MNTFHFRNIRHVRLLAMLGLVAAVVPIRASAQEVKIDEACFTVLAPWRSAYSFWSVPPESRDEFKDALLTANAMVSMIPASLGLGSVVTDTTSSGLASSAMSPGRADRFEQVVECLDWLRERLREVDLAAVEAGFGDMLVPTGEGRARQNVARKDFVAQVLAAIRDTRQAITIELRRR